MHHGSDSYLQKPRETEIVLEPPKDAYQQRVARKLALDAARLEDLLRSATGTGPLGALQRLSQLAQDANPATAETVHHD